MSLCKCKLVFILNIVAILFSETESLCLWNYVSKDSELVKMKLSEFMDFVFEALFEDEVYESCTTGKLSETSETFKSSKSFEELSKADAGSKTDDITQAQEQDAPQKCPVAEDPSSKINTCNLKRTAQDNIQLTEDKFQTPTYHTSSPLFDFNFDTNIKFSNLEYKPLFNLILNFVVLILWVLMVALIFFLTYRKIEVIGKTVENLKERIKSVTEMFPCQNEKTENGQELVIKGHTCQCEERDPEWTPEEVLCHLKQIARTAKSEFPDDKTVEYLSDEFLTQILNFMMDHQKDFRYLTPYELIQHAKYRHLKNHEFRRKERKVKVYVNVNEVHKEGFGGSKNMK